MGYKGTSRYIREFSQDWELDYEILFWKKNSDHSFHQMKNKSSKICKLLTCVCEHTGRQLYFSQATYFYLLENRKRSETKTWIIFCPKDGGGSLQGHTLVSSITTERCILVVYNLLQPTDNTIRSNKLNAMSRFVFHFILNFNGYYYYYFSQGCKETTPFALHIICLCDLLQE